MVSSGQLLIRKWPQGTCQRDGAGVEHHAETRLGTYCMCERGNKVEKNLEVENRKPWLGTQEETDVIADRRS